MGWDGWRERIVVFPTTRPIPTTSRRFHCSGRMGERTGPKEPIAELQQQGGGTILSKLAGFSYSEVGSFYTGSFSYLHVFRAKGKCKTNESTQSIHPSIQNGRCLLTSTTNKTALSLCVVLGGDQWQPRGTCHVGRGHFE